MSKNNQTVAGLSRKKRIFFTLIIITGSLAFSLWIANTVVRKVGRYQAKKYPDYPQAVRQDGLGPGGMLKEGFEERVHDGYGKSVRWKNNDQGFRNDRNFAQHQAPGVLRILSLGDSFTAGYRVGQEDTFSRLLEVWSTRTLAPTEVLISQIEHPDLGLTYLRKFGYQWSPHVVLLGITLGNDIAQAYVSRHPSPIGFRHGLEILDLPPRCYNLQFQFRRFVQKALYRVQRTRLYSAIFHPPLAMTPWYDRHKPLKLFDAQNGLGMFIKQSPPEIELAYQRLLQILLDYQQFCDSRGIEFLVAIFPQRYQVQPQDWRATAIAYNLNTDAFDLMQPNKRIVDFCDLNSIICLDPTAEMAAFHRKSGKDLYLPRGDMHWNRYGHSAWFDGTRHKIQEILQTVIEGLIK
jgi:hypothetical protein